MTKTMKRSSTFAPFRDRELVIYLAKPSGTAGRLGKRFALFHSTTDHKIARHLRKIRTDDEEPTALGYDARHREDDPLWQSEEVHGLLKRRTKRSDSAAKTARSEANRKYYQDRMTKYKAVLSQAQRNLAAGRITQLQYSTRLRDRAVGWFRYRDRVQLLEQEAVLAKESGDPTAIREAKERLQNTIETTSITEMLFRNHYTAIDQMFYDNSLPDGGLPAIPTSTSREDYLKYVALLLPMVHWSKNPMHPQSINKVRVILSSEKTASKFDCLDVGATDTEKLEILQRFNASVLETQDWWREANGSEKKEFLEAWETEKEIVRSAFLPFSNQHSPLVFIRNVRECHSLRLADEEIEGSEEDNDS
jgi:hypothetical protein